MILPQTAKAEALAAAERIRAAIAGAPWPLRPVTASLGVATQEVGVRDKEALITAADQALYRAKRAGRNCICYADEA